jgi:hypothetical protein
MLVYTEVTSIRVREATLDEQYKAAKNQEPPADGACASLTSCFKTASSKKISSSPAKVEVW